MRSGRGAWRHRRHAAVLKECPPGMAAPCPAGFLLLAARAEVRGALARPAEEGVPAFVRDAVGAGLVVRCQDDAGRIGFAPTYGARRLGEVALVPHSSPISASGLLFYNTLFDENASCHIALGQCYSKCFVDGANLTPEQIAAQP